MPRKRIDKPKNKKCLQCNKIFYRKDNEESSNWKSKKFCSKECFYKSRRKSEKICEYCKKSYWMRSYKQRFCSRECMINWREELVMKGKIKRYKLKPNYGKNNVNWKDGITELKEKIRKIYYIRNGGSKFLK